MTLAVFGLLLGVAAVSDLWRRRIPNEICVAITALGLTSNVLIGGFGGLLDGLVGGLVGFFALVGFYAKRQMGAGDVKLLAACGTVLGGAGIVNGVCLALFAGGVFALLVLLVQKLTVYFPRLYTVIPQTHVASGLKIELPYGLAIAVGVLVATQVTVLNVPVLG